jgi:serine/threonine-protein kinase RsbW
MAHHGANARGNRKTGSDQPARPNPPVRPNQPVRLKFDIASDFIAGREVQAKIMDAIESFEYPQDDIFAMKLSLEEGLINAIKHGNKLNPDKRVKIEADISNQQVEIMIEDQGPGFSKKDVPDPTLEENLEKCSGRGILLIETYMTQAEWTKGGRRLRMIFKRRGK